MTRSVSRIFLIVFLSFVYPALANEQDELRTAYLSHERAMNAGDAGAVAALVHPDYTSFTGNGGLLNEKFNESVMARNFKAGLDLNTRSKHIETRVWGNTGLVTAYAEGMVKTPGAEPSYGLSRVTTVWQKQDGKWLLLHQHQSPVVSE